MKITLMQTGFGIEIKDIFIYYEEGSAKFSIKIVVIM